MKIKLAFRAYSHTIYVDWRAEHTQQFASIPKLRKLHCCNLQGDPIESEPLHNYKKKSY